MHLSPLTLRSLGAVKLELMKESLFGFSTGLCGVHAHSDTLMPTAFNSCIVCMLSKLNVIGEKDDGL